MAKPDHERREECASDFKTVFELVGRRVTGTTFWSVNGLLLMVAGAIFGAAFTLIASHSAKLESVQMEQARRGAVIDVLTKQTEAMGNLLQAISTNPDPGLKTILDRLDALDRRMTNLESAVLKKPTDHALSGTAGGGT